MKAKAKKRVTRKGRLSAVSVTRREKADNASDLLDAATLEILRLKERSEFFERSLEKAYQRVWDLTPRYTWSSIPVDQFEKLRHILFYGKPNT